MTPFSLDCGPADAGWVAFKLAVPGQVFECPASYLGLHPICALVIEVADLHEHYFSEPWIDDAPDAEVDVVDEPGGFRLAFKPLDYPSVRFRVYDRPYCLLAVGEEPHGDLLYEGTIPFELLVREVHREAGRCVGQQGLVGLRVGWLGGGRWDCDGPQSSVFPLEHYFLLSRVVRDGPGAHPGPPSLSWEIEELAALLERYGT